ncbi:hypothetical protein [Nostoc sp. 'Peltigera membranacea cyanobiont' 232]|uniref:hypothetical protein n=1 Tax=Nostoc sp. 'Peltigera membranacea cyanobiont' 232 TaxID=2014531 RepID=UPI0016747193|nr:hypothetical protein [Nostoc sp. 'Peltigera membranacea cyanobiont' 232]
MPAAKDDIKAEQVYNALAQSLKAPITEKRIWNPQRVNWKRTWENSAHLPVHYQRLLEDNGHSAGKGKLFLSGGGRE